MTTVSRHDIGTPCWFDLMTSDAEAARRFYGELFAWSFEVGPPETGGYTLCRVMDDRNAVGLGQIPPGSEFVPAWTVYFASDDLDATASAITREGGRTVMAPMDVFGRGRVAAFTDPTGALFGVWQPGDHPGASVVDEPGAMSWCEVNTRDAAGASRFYATVFELEPSRLETPDIEYYTLSRGQKAVAGVLQMTAAWGDLPPHWMAYLGAADPDAVCAVAERLGGQIAVKPFDTPYGRVAVLRDPQGAAFSIVRPPGT